MSSCASHDVDILPKPRVTIDNDNFSTLNIKQTEYLTAWWFSFDRPILTGLIDQALSNNYDIAQSVAILNQTKALQQQTASGALPLIDLQGNTNKNWEGSEGQRGDASVGADLSWELDIWNRVSNATLADQYETQARLEDVLTLKLLISTEVANAYFGAVASNQGINLLKQQLKLDRELEQLLYLRLENGVGTNLELLQQRARVADAEKLIPLAEANLIIFENRLDVLIGNIPDNQPVVPPSDNLKIIEFLPPIEVPSALLLNRPDLRAARAELIASDADIASAISDRLPKVVLGASYSLVDSSNYKGPTTLIMGMFVQPLLDWGKRKAEVNRNKALYEEKISAYTGLYLKAIEEVESALIQESKQREFLMQLSRQKEVLQETVNVAKDRYAQGIDDYLPVIDALKELRDVERNLIIEQLNLVNMRINLHRAVGAPINDNKLDVMKDNP